MKILLKVEHHRISARLNETVNKLQFGFMPNRGTIEAITALKTITSARMERQLSTYIAFVDFEKAFDRVTTRNC